MTTFVSVSVLAVYVTVIVDGAAVVVIVLAVVTVTVFAEGGYLLAQYACTAGITFKGARSACKPTEQTFCAVAILARRLRTDAVN